MPGFSDAGKGELLRLQATGRPHCGRKGSGIKLGQLDLITRNIKRGRKERTCAKQSCPIFQLDVWAGNLAIASSVL